MLLTVPFMAAIQIISACIGWRSRKGLAKGFAQRFPRPVVYVLVGLLVAANTINVAADLAAMAHRFAWPSPARRFSMRSSSGSVVSSRRSSCPITATPGT